MSTGVLEPAARVGTAVAAPEDLRSTGGSAPSRRRDGGRAGVRHWVRVGASRIGAAATVIVATYTLTFFALYSLPSDPAAIAADAAGQNADPEILAQVREVNGLDLPVAEQYWHSLLGVLHLDFGASFVDGQSVAGIVGPSLLSTQALAVPAFVLSVLGGLALAVLAARRVPSRASRFFSFLTPLGTAVPTFWVGLVLLQFFAFGLHLFPPYGEGPALALVLPTLTLAIPGVALVAQILSSSLRDEWGRPYIEVVRAKGVSDRGALVRHVLRAVSGSALSVVAILVGNLLSGAVVVETVFARNGLGRLTFQSVQSQDIPVVLAVVTLISAVVVIASALVEAARSRLDRSIAGPR